METPFFERGECAIRPLVIPLSASGILLDVCHIFNDGGNHLSRTASISDNSHPLSPIVVVMIPTSGVKDFPLEFFHTGELDVARLGDAAYCRDKNGGVSHVDDACEVVPQLDRPKTIFIPRCRDALDIKLHVLSEVKLVDGGFNV